MLTVNKGKIALISVHGDPSVDIGQEEAGGQNVYVRCCGEALAELGWKVDLFTRKSNPEQASIVEHSPHCRTIRLIAGPESFMGRDDLFRYLPEFVDQFKQFQQREGIFYPLVHTNYWLSSWVGMVLKKTQGVKQIHTYHSLGAVKYRSISTIPLVAKTRLEVEKTCLETVDTVVATSPQEQEHLRQFVSSKGNIEMIPCGTNIDCFGSISRQEAREKLGFSQTDKIIFYVGRFDPRKGIETAIRAVHRLVQQGEVNLKLIIGGGFTPGGSDQKERDRILDLVIELGLAEITLFPGRLDHTILPAYYAAADVSVVPSHYEPFGLVTIEAMASGTPVVGSDVGGLQYTIVPEETGLLAPPQDDTAFANAIHRIISNPSWREKLGKQARNRVESQFSWKGVATQLSELYSDHLHQPQTQLFTDSFAG